MIDQVLLQISLWKPHGTTSQEPHVRRIGHGRMSISGGMSPYLDCMFRSPKKRRHVMLRAPLSRSPPPFIVWGPFSRDNQSCCGAGDDIGKLYLTESSLTRCLRGRNRLKAMVPEPSMVWASTEAASGRG